jgi:hypothetical protein
MRRRWVLFGLLLTGCQLDVSFTDSRFFCGNDQSSCPSGQACVQEYCQTIAVLPPDADPDQPDAEPGAPDASVVDANPDDPDAKPGTPDATPPPPDAAPPPDAMPTCTLGHIADDFSSSATAPFWEAFNESPTSASETGGRLVVTLVPNTAGSHFAGYVYKTNTDGRGQHIQIELVQAPSSSNGNAGDAFFKVQNGTNFNNEATFILEAGQLYMDTYDASYNRLSRKQIAFSASNHRFWALEEKNGTVSFLTSPDGSSWTVRESQPVPFPFQNARVAFGAGTWRSETNPGTVQLDNLNVGPSTDCFGQAQ